MPCNITTTEQPDHMPKTLLCTKKVHFLKKHLWWFRIAYISISISFGKGFHRFSQVFDLRRAQIHTILIGNIRCEYLQDLDSVDLYKGCQLPLFKNICYLSQVSSS